MSEAPPIYSEKSIEVLEATKELDPKKIQFAKEVIHFAFSNGVNKTFTDLSYYIGKRFSENFNEYWNCTVWEWNKGGISFICNTRIDIKYNNNKIILWKI